MKKPPPFHAPVVLALALSLVLSAGCSKASKARRRLASADRAFQAQKYDDAEIEYASVLRLSPRNPVAFRQLGLIYFAEGRPLIAFDALKVALKLDPNNTDVQLKLAELYGNRGDLKTGLGLLGSVLQTDPGNARALTLLVEMCPSNEIAHVTQRVETQLREGGPGAAACHAALGWIDLRTQKLGEAESEFQQASAIDPKLDAPYLGLVALYTLRLSEAESEFQKASAMDPKLDAPYLGLIAFYTLRNDLKGYDKALKAAAEVSPVRSAARLKYAEFKRQIGADDEAKEIAREMTRQAPDYIPAWVFLMKVAVGEHKYDECQAMINTILARDSFNYEAISTSGVIALVQHDGAKALSAFQQLDNDYRNVPEVKYNLARAYLMNNENQKAVAILTDLVSKYPDFTTAVLLLANLDKDSGRSGESAALLSQSLKNHPDDVQTQLALAKIYLDEKQPARALEMYQQMAQKFPTDPEIQRLMGAAYAEQGDLTQACAAWEKSLEISPGQLATLKQLNRLDMIEKRYAGAHQRLDRVVADNPKAAEPWILQGDIYQSEGQTNQAEAAYDKAIDLNPALPDAYLSLAGLYVQSHQEKQALDRLGDLVAKQTNNVTALLTIGVIHQKAGRYELARDAYQKLLAVDSNSPGALNNLAYVDSEYLGKVDDGLQLAERAKRLSPYDPRAADTLGWIQFKKHDYAAALGSILEGAEKLSGEPEVQMHLGMAYYMMGEEKPARVWLERALKSPTEFPGKELVRRRLDPGKELLVRRRLEVLNIDPTTASSDVTRKLESLVQEDPQDPVPLSRLAAIQEQLGESQKAADSLRTLLSINPQDWSAMIRLSRLYAGPLNNLREALVLAKLAHKTAPDDGQASALLGDLVYRSGDYSWALILLEEAADKLSNQPSLLYHLALAYYAVGRATEADAAMGKAIEQGVSPPDLDHARQFVAMRAAVNDPDHAQLAGAQAEQILAQDPTNVPALMVSAMLAERRGAVEEAVQSYKKALTIYPQFTPAMRQLAILYSHSQNSGDLDKAYDYAKKAWASLPDDLELVKILGIVTFRRGDYKESVALLGDYAGKSADDAEGFYYLGMDYAKLKQPTGAKQALQRALELHVAEPLAGQAQVTLKELK
jgi:tetratricopeptide (TPR) repeat protein